MSTGHGVALVRVSMASGWLDGLLPSSVQSGQVNGLPAVFAIARAGEWNFRVALIRKGDDIYRLMFAARSLNEDTERRFRQSIDSFRSLADDEAAKVKPQLLRIVVDGGEPADALAQRMAADRPLDTFLLLNGLAQGASVRAGETYKLVIEQ